MKVLLVIVTLLSFNAFADKHGKEMSVDEKKARILEKLDKRISSLTNHKSCVSAATTMEALKACKEQMRAERRQMKEQWKAKRDEMSKKK